MDNTTPTPPVTQPVAPMGGGGNNKTLIIVIIAVIVIGGGYWAFHRWQQQRAISNLLKGFGMDGSAANMLGKGMAGFADEMAQEAAKEEAEAKKSPADKFKDAETIEIASGSHSELASEIGDAIKKVFDDAKVTGFTSGYMGMNSGSGVVQYTVPKLLALNDVNNLSKELEDKGFTIMTTGQQSESATIMAQKNSVTYTIGYNKDEQEITVIIIKTEGEVGASE
ncbi:MAG: hypothetical protein NTW66_01905 [Candidatus Magasanikbacteria bacterium]|nr:hypothetical protein [Candidatus Magasanikbacteria bacterium]